MKRTTLLAPAQRVLSEGSLAGRGGQREAPWAQEEFAQARLPDRRRVKRLIIMATDFAQHPTAPIPQACGTWDKTKAAYRYFDNDSVQPQAILQAHVQATLQRLQAQPLGLLLLRFLRFCRHEGGVVEKKAKINATNTQAL